MRHVVGYGWICALAFSLLVSAQNCYRAGDSVVEYAAGCDAFGYLMMAKEIRQAVAIRELPTFQIKSPQIGLLVDLMRSRNVPPNLWNEMVAPHAHHYFSKTGYVGAQYPPGTAIVLAFFPEGEALYRLNVATIGLITVIGMVVLVIAVMRGTWISAGCMVLALETGLSILEHIGEASFSVNAVIGPLLLSVVLLFAVLTMKADARAGWAGLAAFLAGIFLGFGVLTRLSVILLAPGLVGLLWSAPWRKSLLRRVLPFATGLTLIGILPILVQQSRVAGAWYLPTYGVADATPPSLAPVLRNISFYLGHGPGSQDNLLLLAIGLGFAGLVLDPRRRNSSRLSARRLALSTALLWGLPTVFFLTHEIAIPYYGVPASFGAALMLALGIFIIELFPAHPVANVAAGPTGKLRHVALALALIPGFVAVREIRWFAQLSNPTGAHSELLSIPPELSDERSWIWADMLTGSLRYYGNKTAFKVPFSDPNTRELAYAYAFDRGDRQYVIVDSPTMWNMLKEMTRMGAVPQLKGSIAGAPYYLLNWNSGGPHSISAASPPAPKSSSKPAT